jgi:ADP-ribose pyrophosphatase
MMPENSMKVSDVEVIDKDRVFEGYFGIDRYRIKHRQYEGGMGDEITREIFERGHAASCLLYDPALNKLVLIEQFRAGAYAALSSPWYDPEKDTPWLIEIIAGIIEDGEDPEEVIRREAVEEAGCNVLQIEPVFHYLVTPGGSSESMFTFLGRVDASNIGGIHGLKDEGEDIRVFTVDVEEAFDLLDQGRIMNSMTMLPLQWFRSRHQDIRARWLAEG